MAALACCHRLVTPLLLREQVKLVTPLAPLAPLVADTTCRDPPTAASRCRLGVVLVLVLMLVEAAVVALAVVVMVVAVVAVHTGWM